MEGFRAVVDRDNLPAVIAGDIGPRGDGYVPSAVMTSDQGRRLSSPRRSKAFADTEADLVSALTLNYVDEAIGIALAARSASMPVVLSFTVETDGRLPTGETLQSASRRPMPQPTPIPRTTWSTVPTRPTCFGGFEPGHGARDSRYSGERFTQDHAELNGAAAPSTR